MIAIIKTGGKQYVVKEGDTLRVEKLDTEAGKTITFDDVLLVAEQDGSTVKVGEPHVSKAKVEATVVEHGRARKVMVKKFKAKVRYARTYGHRQPFTTLNIQKITA